MINDDISVDFMNDDDSERAQITIRSFGCVSELRFADHSLDAVAEFSSVDIRRLLDALTIAEQKRIDPDSKTIECIKYLREKIDYASDDKSSLYLQIEAIMPIAASGAIRLEPLFDGKTIKERDGDDAS